MLEKQDDARDESVEAVFLSILRQKDLDMRDKKAAIVDFIAAGIHTVRKSRCTNYGWRAISQRLFQRYVFKQKFSNFKVTVQLPFNRLRFTLLTFISS